MHRQICTSGLFFMIMHASLLGMSNEEFVLREIVVRNVGHRMQRLFAVLNTEYNNSLNMYRPHKKPIEDFLQQEKPDITGDISWNRDFSRCAWVTVSDIDPFSDLNNLQLTLVGSTGKNGIKRSSGAWQDFSSHVFEDNIRPFFDKEGRACFYTYDFHGIYEYSVGLNNDAECCRCLYEISEKGCGNFGFLDDFETMLCLPILLKAFLLSRQTRKLKQWDALWKKFFYIEGVIIPEDFKTVRENTKMRPSVKDRYGSYDSLSVKLKTAIEKRYEEQQRGKC